MTTIAYKDGFMAADSKVTANGAHVTRLFKIHRLSSGALLGVCGDADCRDVVALLDKCKSSRSLPSREALAKTKTDFGGILVLRNGDVYDVDIGHDEDVKDWFGGIVPIKEGYHSVGSGSEFALGAMAAGVNAAQAVRVACKYDVNSGEPVRVVPLKETKSQIAA